MKNTNYERWDSCIYDGDSAEDRQILNNILRGDAFIEKLTGFSQIYKTRDGEDRVLFVDLGDKRFAFLLRLTGHRYNHLKYLKNYRYIQSFVERVNLTDNILQDEDNVVENVAQEQSSRVYYFNRRLVVLDATQENALTTPTPLVVTGGAGTGKTMIACIKIQQWLADRDASDTSPILYVSLSAALVHEIEHALRTIGITSQDVHCKTYQQVMLEKDTSLAGRNIVDFTHFSEWFTAQYLTKSKVKKSEIAKRLNQEDAKGVYEVFREIAGGLRTERSARSLLACKISDIAVALDAYMQFLLTNGDYDPALCAVEVESSYYGCIVDEAQQFTPQQWLMLCKLVPHTECAPNIIFVGDEYYQRSFDSQCLLREKITLLTQYYPVNQLVLEQGYRLPENVKTFTNHLVTLRNLLHVNVATRSERVLTSDANVMAGNVVVERASPQLIQQLKLQTQLPHCFVITSEKSRKRAAARFGADSLIFTPNEVGGQECEKAIVFELFGQDNDDLLLMSLDVSASHTSLRLDESQPVLIKKGADYFLHGYNGKKWCFANLDKNIINTHPQLRFPEVGAEPVYVQATEDLKALYIYLEQKKLHMVQDDPMLANIEKRLRESKKHTPAGGGMQQDDIITWVNARIIACTRLTDILWVLFPEQTKYPLLFEFLKPALKSSDLDLINVELDSASLRQEWLEFADRLQLKFTPENAQKAREIYLRYGLTEEDIELRKASLLSRSVIIQSLTTSQQTQKEFLNQFYFYLTSHKLAVFFQEHSIENLKLLVKDDCSLLEKILQVKSHSNILYDYFLENVHQFTLLENLYSSDELLQLIIKTSNVGMLKLLITFGRDLTPEEEQQYANCYPEVKKIFKHSLKILLTGKSFLGFLFYEHIETLFKVYFDAFIDSNFNKQLLISRSVIPFLYDNDYENINYNEETFIMAVNVGNLDFVKNCVTDPNRKYMLTSVAVYISVILFEQYEILDFILNNIDPCQVGKILLFAIKQQNTTVIDSCVAHRFNLIYNYDYIISEVEIEFSDLIESNIILKQEFVKYNLAKALLQKLSIRNLSAYFNFLINNNQLSELMSSINYVFKPSLDTESIYHTTSLNPMKMYDMTMNKGNFVIVFEFLLGKKEDFKKFLLNNLKKHVSQPQNSILFTLADYSFVYNDKSTTFLELAYEYGADWFVLEYVRAAVLKVGIIEGLGSKIVGFDIENGKQTLLNWVLSQFQYTKEIIFEYLYNNNSELNALQEFYGPEVLLDILIKHKNIRLIQLLLAFGKPLENNVVLEKYTMYSRFKACHKNSIRVHLKSCATQKDLYLALFDDLDILTKYLKNNVDSSEPRHVIQYGYFDPNNSSLLENMDFLFSALLVGNTQVFECYIEKFGISQFMSLKFYSYPVYLTLIHFNQYEIFAKIAHLFDINYNTLSFVYALKIMSPCFLDLIMQYPVNLLILSRDQTAEILTSYDYLLKKSGELSLSPLVLKEVIKFKMLSSNQFSKNDCYEYLRCVELGDKELGIYDDNAPFKNIDSSVLRLFLTSTYVFTDCLYSDCMEKSKICYTETLLYKLSNTVCDSYGNIGLHIAYKLDAPVLIDLFGYLDAVDQIAHENKYTTIGLAFIRMRDMTQSSALRAIDQDLIHQIIKIRGVRRSYQMCKSNPEWMPIHAAIECQSSLILTTILQIDNTVINAKYQNRTPVFMVLQQYATMSIKVMKLMLMILNKYGADFRQDQAELCEMLRSLEQIVPEEEKKFFNDIIELFPEYRTIRPTLSFFAPHESFNSENALTHFNPTTR